MQVWAVLQQTPLHARAFGRHWLLTQVSLLRAAGAIADTCVRAAGTGDALLAGGATGGATGPGLGAALVAGAGLCAGAADAIADPAIRAAAAAEARLTTAAADAVADRRQALTGPAVGGVGAGEPACTRTAGAAAAVGAAVLAGAVRLTGRDLFFFFLRFLAAVAESATTPRERPSAPARNCPIAPRRVTAVENILVSRSKAASSMIDPPRHPPGVRHADSVPMTNWRRIRQAWCIGGGSHSLVFMSDGRSASDSEAGTGRIWSRRTTCQRRAGASGSATSRRRRLWT